MICYRVQVTNWCKSISRVMDSIPRVQHNASMYEQGAVQHETLILAALATHIALV